MMLNSAVKNAGTEYTIAELLEQTFMQFTTAGIESPELDSRLLLQSAAGITHADIVANGNMLVGREKQATFEHLIQRRLGHEPVSRILGQREFWGLDIAICCDVLDPRADTECLVEAVIVWAGEFCQTELRIADIGTGSGAIALALLHELKNSRIQATDISRLALDQAKANARSLEMTDRIEFSKGAWCEPLAGKFDVIVSNPPYIKSEIIPDLAPEVRDNDPAISLDGGNDGLEAYRQILGNAAGFLKDSGRIFLEIGYGQGKSVASIADNNGWVDAKILNDMAGKDRVFSASPGI